MKLYDVRAKVGEYEVNGETKSKYLTIGVIIETRDGKTMLKLDAIPVGWDGFAYLNDPIKKEVN